MPFLFEDLVAAVKAGNLERVKECLLDDTVKAVASKYDAGGPNCALREAVSAGHLEIVEFLLTVSSIAKGITAADWGGDHAALRIACKSDHERIAVLLEKTYKEAKIPLPKNEIITGYLSQLKQKRHNFLTQYLNTFFPDDITSTIILPYEESPLTVDPEPVRGLTLEFWRKMLF